MMGVGIVMAMAEQVFSKWAWQLSYTTISEFLRSPGASMIRCRGLLHNFISCILSFQII